MKDHPLGGGEMFGGIHGTLALAGVLSLVVLLIAVCAQGRLQHAILWLLGEVPRHPLSIASTIPRAERYWSIVARLDQSLLKEVPVPEEEPSPEGEFARQS